MPTKIIELEGKVSRLFKAPFEDDDENLSMSLQQYTDRLMNAFNNQSLNYIENK